MNKQTNRWMSLKIHEKTNSGFIWRMESFSLPILDFPTLFEF